MGIYRQHFHCVELVSEKSEISSYPTRWGAERRCHDLNKWNPQERWTVRPSGIRYVPDYNEQGNKSRKIPFKDCLKQHFKAVKGKNCNCLFCRNLNRKED